MSEVVSPSRRGGLSFPHPMAFWLGLLAVTIGVLLHLPVYIQAADMDYMLAGMGMDAAMITGMVLIVVGLASCFYGLYPRLSRVSEGFVSKISVHTLDDAPLRRSHVALLLVMAAAVTVDVIKPTTLAFVVPGMAMEYGLKAPVNPTGTIPVAWLPLGGIVGTVVGSFLWGWLGDRIGRRSSILLAGVVFVATSICGSMPVFWMNVMMCFLMGLGVGGMLPVTFTLLAETVPARHRGWLMVLIGGDVAGAYIITSWLATALLPEFGWRIMWLLGVPTGLALILLNRWIPESPRYLLAQGREAEAREIMEIYGAAVVMRDPTVMSDVSATSGFRDLFRGGLASISLVVVLLGLGIGLVSFGFQLWIPSNLRQLGFSDISADKLLRDSALIGFPLNFLVSWAYGFWSSKRTIIFLAGATAFALFGFAAVGDDLASRPLLLKSLLVVPIWGISSLVAVLSVYGSEIFPTRIRARGSGLAAGASKFGGVVIIGAVVAAVATPSIAGTALLGGIPLLLAAGALLFFGVETRQRPLEGIASEELGAGR